MFLNELGSHYFIHDVVKMVTYLFSMSMSKFDFFSPLFTKYSAATREKLSSYHSDPAVKSESGGLCLVGWASLLHSSNQWEQSWPNTPHDPFHCSSRPE
jgi:hypothetical protein